VATIERKLALLKKRYGPGAIPEPSDPFAMIIWENCAYLVDDERRTNTYQELRERVGETPLELLSAGDKSIEAAIAGGGMNPAHRAAKVLRCAEIALEFADGDLSSALAKLDDKARRRLLKRFPGIGDPGADKLLLLGGYSNEPALDSNGLRVLERLGVVPPSSSYAASYRAGVSYLRKQKVDAREAFALLREHGRTLCKRTNPRCAECPLQKICPSAFSV
jgi:endonuclease III